MRRLIILQVVFLCLPGCSEFELFLRDDLLKSRPAVVLIGRFESRNMNYDPFISDEFREALRFEFFKRGYNAILVGQRESGTSTGSISIPDIFSATPGDILVSGGINQRETGSLTDRRVSSTVTFVMHVRTGTVIGEGYYFSDKPAGDESFRRACAAEFANYFHDRLKR